MRIKLLDLAERDLIEGFRFYEAQEAGLGSYFLANLYTDIESFRLYAGVHEKPFKLTIVCFPVDSLLQFSTPSRKTSRQSMLSWIVGEIRPGSERGSNDLPPC